MKDSTNDFLIKVIAAVIGLWTLAGMADRLAGDGGVFYKAFVLLGGLFFLLTAVQFAFYKGWAFLVVSVGLLVGFLATLVGFITAIDRGDGTALGEVRTLVAIVVLIGYLGRWSMERRFRPELEIEHH